MQINHQLLTSCHIDMSTLCSLSYSACHPTVVDDSYLHFNIRWHYILYHWTDTEKTVTRLNLCLKWSGANGVKFNATKSRRAFSLQNGVSFTTHLSNFGDVFAPISDHSKLLGLGLSFNLYFGPYIECLVKSAAKILSWYLSRYLLICIIFKVRRYFTPEQFLNLYQAQVCSCM